MPKPDFPAAVDEAVVQLKVSDFLQLLKQQEVIPAHLLPQPEEPRPMVAPIGSTHLGGRGRPRKWIPVPMNVWLQIQPLINLYKPELADELHTYLEGIFEQERKRGQRRRQSAAAPASRQR